jgi:tetratricopeptide (TPR) repeat protein
MLLHAGLLLGTGEATRASYVLVIAGQRPGIPKAIRQGFEGLLAHTQRVGKRPNALIQEGIKLHDQGKYDEALKKYREALGLWQQNSWAHYEIGYTLLNQQLVAAGAKPLQGEGVSVNAGLKHSAEVLSAFAKTRRHDPFAFKAYQGDDQKLIHAVVALAKDGLPAWQKIAQNRDKRVDVEVLQQLATACQESGNHELALIVRQIMVARRGRYAPADHPFFTTSLRALAPGPQIEALLKLLGGDGALNLRQLVVPEAPAKVEYSNTKVVDVKAIRFYVPIDSVSTIVGDDPEPFGEYIKTLQRTAARLLENEKLSKAKGLLVAVIVKPGKKARVWCQNVEGEIPAEILQKLEKELAKVGTISVKHSALAFGLEMSVRQQGVAKFPEFPTVWLEAAKQSKIKVLIPPDELFKVIWPD